MAYITNPTMRLLGHQDYSIVQHDQLQNIKEAYINASFYNVDSMQVDAYMLGYIMGKRDERARKRGWK